VSSSADSEDTRRADLKQASACVTVIGCCVMLADILGDTKYHRPAVLYVVKKLNELNKDQLLKTNNSF